MHLGSARQEARCPEEGGRAVGRESEATLPEGHQGLLGERVTGTGPGDKGLGMEHSPVETCAKGAHRSAHGEAHPRRARGGHRLQICLCKHL